MDKEDVGCVCVCVCVYPPGPSAHSHLGGLPRVLSGRQAPGTDRGADRASTLTQWGGGGHFFKVHLFSRTVGREGRCKQITLAYARSASATLGLPPLTARVSS